MMDESSLEPMHFGNSVAVKDEETDCTTTKFDWSKLINEKQSIENSHVVEAIPFEEKVKKLDPVFFLGSAAGIKPHILVAHKTEGLSSAEERRVHYTLPSPLDFKPFIRKKVTQEEIVFNRECKKLEKVWTNRGLPVDRETVCSAASKDAFDLKDLSESLPSTSTSVNKPSIIENETGCQLWASTGMVSLFHQRIVDMERTPNRGFPTKIFYRPFNPRYFTHSCKATNTSFPVSETVLSDCDSMRETVRKEKLLSLVRAQRWMHLKRWTQSHRKNFHRLLYSEKPECDEQKEASEDSLSPKIKCDEQKEASEDTLSSKIKKFVSNMTHRHQELSPNPHFSTLEQPNFGSEFAKMSIDDNQDEKKKETQDSNDENHLPSPVLNPLPPIVTNYVPKMELSSNWDPDKNWTTIFDWVSHKFDEIAQEFSDPPAPVPFNSPTKKEENAGKIDLFWSMEKGLAEVRLNALKHLREQNKSKALNSYRRIITGDEDSAESEKPSLGKASRRVVIRKSGLPKVDSSTQTESSTERLRENIDKLKGHKQMIREMKESIKNVRTFHFPFSRRHIVKSDKVVPD